MAAMTCVIGHMAACEVAWDTWQPVRWHRTCVKGTHDSQTTCQFMDLVSMQPTIIQGNPTPLSNWKLSITFQRRRDSHFPTQDFPSPPFLFREEGLVNQKAYKRRVPHLIAQAFPLHRKAGAILPLQPLDIYIPWRHSHALKTNSLACILLGSPHLHKGLHFMFILLPTFPIGCSSHFPILSTLLLMLVQPFIPRFLQDCPYVHPIIDSLTEMLSKFTTFEMFSLHVVLKVLS